LFIPGGTTVSKPLIFSWWFFFRMPCEGINLRLSLKNTKVFFDGNVWFKRELMKSSSAKPLLLFLFTFSVLTGYCPQDRLHCPPSCLDEGAEPLVF